MFTGIIETLGTVDKKTATTLSIKAKIKKPKLGASIAVNGCCLTVVKTKNNVHQFDVGPETWERTNLGDLEAGDPVNVEPSLRVGDELGGHLVAGHVDAAGEVLELQAWGQDFRRLRVAHAGALAGLIAVKGSIAVDGVSLTVTKAEPAWFEVMLIPHTFSSTTLGHLAPGDRVNLEADPLARYAKAAAEALRSA